MTVDRAARMLVPCSFRGPDDCFPIAPSILDQPFFMFIGLYLLYGGILLTYDNIPAGFRWIYYTNPGQLLCTCANHMFLSKVAGDGRKRRSFAQKSSVFITT